MVIYNVLRRVLLHISGTVFRLISSGKFALAVTNKSG